ncbi:hypothetical protein DP939_14120 [Spongiactinospora rosea]|uniref:Uncharacterized protein n=1 Tax=Spongiactinospora rosea TaxID=2248750 RepID=A0A366M233_9ACTN|nr:DUF6300 family protein [Spongiactinospora rosea]RBQ19840.1 hypothetical protein DP939_14120 [Spongiactinospora rosea]
MSTHGKCPRCRAGDVLAVLRLPHTWTNTSGNPVRGLSEVLLCTRCDAADPLVTYLAVHPSPCHQDATTLARLLRHWIGRARPPRPDPLAVEAESAAWHRGDL